MAGLLSSPRLSLLVIFDNDLLRYKEAAQQAQYQRPDLQILIGAEDGMDLLFEGDV